MVNRIGPGRPPVDRSPPRKPAAASKQKSPIAVEARKPGTRTLSEELRKNEEEALGSAFDRVAQLKAMGKQSSAQADAERAAQLRSRVGRDSPDAQRQAPKAK